MFAVVLGRFAHDMNSDMVLLANRARTVVDGMGYTMLGSNSDVAMS